MKLLLFLCLGVLGGASDVTLSFGGSGVKAVKELVFEFSLPDITIKDVAGGLVEFDVPEPFVTRLFKGEPALPVLREFIALPGHGEWDVIVEDVETVPVDLNGRRVIPSKGELFMKDNPDDFPLVFSDSYSTATTTFPTALVYPVHEMRDVIGTILEVNPVIYDATTETLELVTSCKIRVVCNSKTVTLQPTKVVDGTFYDLYDFHYKNFEHVADRFIKGDDLGRMVVFYDSKFKASADQFASWKKSEGLKDVMVEPCGSSASGIKDKIKKYYGESDSLTYVVLIGNSCPTFTCQQTRRECDSQYAQMHSGDNTLDIFVSRLAASSQSGLDAQLNKFKEYAGQKLMNETADYNFQSAGLALDLMGDEYKYMHRNLDLMTKFGFTKAHYMQDNTATSTQVVQDWNDGMGMYYYIGHGSGTKWNCPQRTGGMSESDITNKLSGNHMYPFVLTCACQNGGFVKQKLCFAEAMVSKPNGGAISMYSSAPDAKSSSPKDLQSGATDVMVGKKATRVGPIYFAGIMYAYKVHPSQALYTMQGYNMFGDPSLQVHFLR